MNRLLTYLAWVNVLLVTLAIADSQTKGAAGQERTFFLLTWKTPEHSWYYLLHEGLTFRDAIRRDGRAKNGPIEQMKAELLKHKNDRIIWSTSRALGFEYPPDKGTKDIQAFAKAQRIHLELIPTIEE